MGDFQKYLELVKEKLRATINAYNNKQSTVVGDLGTKVVEQLVEANAARKGESILATTRADINTQIRISLLKSIKQCVRYGLPTVTWVMTELMAKEPRQ